MYHINPGTGNPNQCRAKKSCPFGGPALHYSSKNEAAEAYELSQGKSHLSSLKSHKISKGAKLLMESDRIWKIIDTHGDAYIEASDSELHNLVDSAINARRAIEQKLRDLPWDHSDEPVWEDTEVEFEGLNFSGNAPRQGLSNGHGKRLTEVEHRIYEQLDKAGAEWIKRLSTAEIKALYIYNGDARDYAAMTAGDEPDPNNYVGYLHSALAKAPKVKAPFMAYAGLSRRRGVALRQEAEAGAITLDRLQSASVNPAIVNTFMTGPVGDFDNTVSIEVPLTRLASLAAFNVNRHEMEVLIAPQEFKVVKKLSDVEYHWPGGGGRTARAAFKLEPL